MKKPRNGMAAKATPSPSIPEIKDRIESPKIIIMLSCIKKILYNYKKNVNRSPKIFTKKIENQVIAMNWYINH